MSKKPYTDLIANAFQTVRAWQAATLVVGAVAVSLAFGLVYVARNTPTILVPYDFATNNQRMKVSTNGEIRGTSSEYMVNTAVGDIALITNFTPDTVVTQYERFLNRMTDSLYASQQTTLRVEAKKLRADATTQAFFPNEKTRILPGGDRVEVSGTLIRWIGDREILRQSMTYIVTYTVFRGFFHVADIRTAESIKEAAKEAKKP
jgi:type IV conjugative transfer system protein TraE